MRSGWCTASQPWRWPLRVRGRARATSSSPPTPASGSTAADRTRYRDRNQPAGERADLVLVVRVPAGGQPTVYSLPRDLYVGQQRDRPHRLGLSLQDGPQAMVDSLCSDVGVGVDHVLIVDMDAVVRLVDTTGPVTVRTTAPVRDRRAALSLERAGLHRLDGRHALAWVRSRHPEVLVDGRWVPDPTSDPTRTSHAVEVLTQVRAHLDDPVSVQRGAWDVGPRLRRDRGLGAAELVRLGAALGAATQANRLVSVPARLSGTEVPFAFVTPETEQALRPLRSRRGEFDATAPGAVDQRPLPGRRPAAVVRVARTTMTRSCRVTPAANGASQLASRSNGRSRVQPDPGQHLWLDTRRCVRPRPRPLRSAWAQGPAVGAAQGGMPRGRAGHAAYLARGACPPAGLGSPRDRRTLHRLRGRRRRGQVHPGGPAPRGLRGRRAHRDGHPPAGWHRRSAGRSATWCCTATTWRRGPRRCCSPPTRRTTSTS